MEHRDIICTYEWMPEIRIKLVARDKREFDFPQVGRWLAENADFSKNTLSGKQCKALWQWLGRTDKPPAKLWVMVNREDVMRVFPEIKP